jgi:hypothetical protein
VPNPRVNLTGQKFGRLTVIEMINEPKKASRCRAICECGTVKEYNAFDVKRGSTKSCGCLRAEVLDKTTHGLKHHPGYSIWHAMHSRCYDEENKDYINYGGRGITVSEDWHRDNADGLKNFCKWLDAQGVRDGLSVDRRNNDLGYSPSNCRLATPKEQTENSRPRRKRRILCVQG